MLKFCRFTPYILFAACCLSGCHEARYGEKIPAPAEAQGVERHSMPSIKASQLNFYLTTKKDDVGVFEFYANRFAKKGWISCHHESHWFDYSKNIDVGEQIRIRQNSYYMVLPDKKQLLMIAAQYHIDHSEDTNERMNESFFKEYVKVVRYKLNERGYGMAANIYECVSKDDT